MKKAILIGFLSIFLGSCSFFKKDSNVELPYNTTGADLKHYETIGLDFKNYIDNDISISQMSIVEYDYLLMSWKENGSTWETYDKIAGYNSDGLYFVYLNNDTSLSEADKKSRTLNVNSWELNLESRLGAAPKSGERNDYK